MSMETSLTEKPLSNRFHIESRVSRAIDEIMKWRISGPKKNGLKRRVICAAVTTYDMSAPFPELHSYPTIRLSSFCPTSYNQIVSHISCS